MSFNSVYYPIQTKYHSDFVTVLDTSAPIDDEFEEKVPIKAKQYPFKLDPFQMQAIIHLEKHSNVFVAAHTSAGKTVVAEYAIAMAFRANTRVIYTSPIKALSNQKYRDFKNEFSDVGLLTGDVQIKPEANCLIMTTEILLQMLYNSSEVINDLEWVIFDEVHYINDPERGHVWEEVFILLPEKVNLVLLSATVPNYVQFADWLGRTRKRKTYVVATSKRPVPLEHFLYTGKDGKTKDQRFLILDKEGKFKKDGYDDAKSKFEERIKKFGVNKNPQTERNIYINLIRHLEKKDKLPVIFFTLSRNRCDNNLKMLMDINKDSFSLTTKQEEAKIHKFISKSVHRLKSVDQQLPQIIRVREMLKRGFGVHHSGILPILKEITEILFCDGLIKVLFATETFAMGVNMPARTVAFDSINKHDGNQFRDLKASEYIQMAGRAGRRGKDLTGTVIIVCKYEFPDPNSLQKIMIGSASELVSQFRLTYHMILNLHRHHDNSGNSIENVLERSFGEHSKVRRSLDFNKQFKSLQTKIEEFPSLQCDICSVDIENFCNLYDEYQTVANYVMPHICMKAMQNRFLNTGRILAISTKSNPFQAAVLLKVNKGKNNDISDILVLTFNNDKEAYECTKIDLKSIHRILSLQIKNIDLNEIMRENEKNFRKIDEKIETMSLVEKFEKLSIPNSYKIFDSAFVDPEKNLQLKEITIAENLREFNNLRNSLLLFNCLNCNDFGKHFVKTCEKLNVVKELECVDYELSSKSLQLLPEYEQRIQVLLEKDYIDKHYCLKLKGKVACLISEHELVISEMLVNNVLGDMSKEEIVALLSCFVFQQKDDSEQTLPDMLKNKIKELLDVAREIGELQVRCGLRDQPVDHFVDTLKFGLVQVVYEWAKGMPFVEVIKLTEVQEGIIVRCIQRLDELLKFVKLASKVVGNSELETKIESASHCIKRDIVFSASLYIINETENVSDSDDDNENISSNFL